MNAPPGILDRDGTAATGAETGAALSIFFPTALGLPVSTTHAIAGAIAGVGSFNRFKAVRWGIAGHIVLAWVATIPACIVLGWAIYHLLHLITGAH